MTNKKSKSERLKEWRRCKKPMQHVESKLTVASCGSSSRELVALIRNEMLDEQVRLALRSQVTKELQQQQQGNTYAKLIQRIVKPDPERVRAVKEACEVCEQQMEVPDIIKRLSPNILAIHPKLVEKEESKYREQKEMPLEIAYPKIKDRPPMAEPPGPAGTEFEYIPVLVKLPFVIDRPNDPITFLGVHESGMYVVKARHYWLEAHCGIRRPVVWKLSPIEHKKNLRPLATEYQEVFDQFKKLGDVTNEHTASSLLQRYLYTRDGGMQCNPDKNPASFINHERSGRQASDASLQRRTKSHKEIVVDIQGLTDAELENRISGLYIVYGGREELSEEFSECVKEYSDRFKDQAITMPDFQLFERIEQILIEIENINPKESKYYLKKMQIDILNKVLSEKLSLRGGISPLMIPLSEAPIYFSSEMVERFKRRYQERPEEFRKGLVCLDMVYYNLESMFPRKAVRDIRQKVGFPPFTLGRGEIGKGLLDKTIEELKMSGMSGEVKGIKYDDFGSITNEWNMSKKIAGEIQRYVSSKVKPAIEGGYFFVLSLHSDYHSVMLRIESISGKILWIDQSDESDVTNLEDLARKIYHFWPPWSPSYSILTILLPPKPADFLGQSATNQSVQRQPIQRGVDYSLNLDDDTVTRINHERGEGQSLEEISQKHISKALGHNFSEVYIHTSPEADDLNRQLNAKAFTTGNDIFFREGEYQPHTTEGQELIAHELTHVLQQASGAVGGSSGKMTVNPPGDRFEQEADAVAKEVVSSLNHPQVQRQVPEEDEELQTKALQRQAVPEEEEVESLQGQEVEEDEEELNA